MIITPELLTNHFQGVSIISLHGPNMFPGLRINNIEHVIGPGHQFGIIFYPGPQHVVIVGHLHNHLSFEIQHDRQFIDILRGGKAPSELPKLTNHLHHFSHGGVQKKKCKNQT